MKTYYTIRIVAWLFLFCAYFQPEVKANQPEFLFVKYSELVTNGREYDGKLIAVVGYYVQQAPDSILYSEKPSGKNYHGKMLWVGGNMIEKSTDVVRKDGAWSIVIGTYKNGAIGIFGKYFGQLDRVVVMYPIEVQGGTK